MKLETSPFRTKLNVIHDQGENFEGIGYSEEYGMIYDLIHIASEKTFPAFVDLERNWLISDIPRNKCLMQRLND